MDQQNITDKINNEVNKIIIDNWNFLEYNWPVINYKYKHRTIIKHINNINEIKKGSCNFFFLFPFDY